MKNEQLADIIMEKMGGKENIQDAVSCMTRLRLHAKNPDLVDREDLKHTGGVLGLIADHDYFQLVLGPGRAGKVADIIRTKAGIHLESVKTMKSGIDWKANRETVRSRRMVSGVRRFLNLIARIFIPMIPAIIAAGLFNGFGSLIGQLLAEGTLSGSFWTITQLLFGLIGSAFLAWFAIYTGISAAQIFGATPAMGGMIGGISIGMNIVEISTLLGLYNREVPLQSILTTGKGGIIGVIFGVWVLSRVEKAIRRYMPDVLDLVVTPFCSLLVCGVLMVFVIMPAAGFVSDWLVAALSLIINSSNPVVSVISGYVLSAVFLPLVLLGLHHGLVPIYALQLEQMGGVSLFPVLAMAGAGQVGAAIALYFMAKKARDAKLQQIIAGALPAGFLGVGEPLIYGVTLPLGKPFVTAGLGAGFGGAYIMLMHVMANAWGPSGLVAVPLMQGTTGMLNYFIGLCIAYVMGFVMTWLLMRPKDLRHGG